MVQNQQLPLRVLAAQRLSFSKKNTGSCWVKPKILSDFCRQIVLGSLSCAVSKGVVAL